MSARPSTQSTSNGANFNRPQGMNNSNKNGKENRFTNLHTQTPPRTFHAIPYSEEERQRIQGLLDRILGPEYVSFRPGGGGQKVSYIEGWKALNLANEVFGFNGWSSELISTQVDFFDTHGSSGRISMGLSVVVRITIKDGTYHEDFGYGYIDNAKNKAMAFEKCKKEAFTDGLKRCLRCFGNVLGNCLYDKTIISKMQKVRLPAAELESSDFHRDPLIVQRERRKQQTTRVKILEGHNENAAHDAHSGGNKPQLEQHQDQQTIHDKFKTPIASNNRDNGDGDIPRDHRDYESKDHPQMEPSTSNSRPSSKKHRNQEPPHKAYEIVGDFDDSLVFSDDMPMEDEEMSFNDGLDEYELQVLLHKGGVQEKTPIEAQASEAITTPMAAAAASDASANTPGTSALNNSNQHNTGLQDKLNYTPGKALFVSAKKADVLQKTPQEVSNIPQFDPKYVSPSLRRTVDQSKSVPIRRNDVPKLGGDTAKASATMNRHNVLAQSVTNPSTGPDDKGLNKRMVGMPPSQRPPLKKLHKE